MLLYQAKTNFSDRKVRRVAGLHISGPNAPKTAVAILEGDPASGRLSFYRLYEKIGSSTRMFSDERVLQILDQEGPFHEVMVDCPLSVPPCVSCERPVCPGVLACDDVTVAYMLSMTKRIPRERRRPINPQTQRLWDVMRQASHGGEEPSYSANLAPLVIRARTLQRRLNSLAPAIQLKETSIQHSLAALMGGLGLATEVAARYRNFESGRLTRESIITAMEVRGWIDSWHDDEDRAKIILSVENFQAFVASVVAALEDLGKCEEKPECKATDSGSICIPDTSALRAVFTSP